MRSFRTWLTIAVIGSLATTSIYLFNRKKYPQRSLIALSKLLESPKSSVRKSAAEELILYEKQGLPAIRKALKHKKWYVRQSALYILVHSSKLVASRTIFELLHTFQDPDKRVRDTAYWAMSTIGLSQKNILQQALAHPNWKLRLEALKWIKKIGSKKMGLKQGLLAALKTQNKKAKKFVIEELRPFLFEQFTDEEKKDFLQGLYDPHWEIRSRILYHLARQKKIHPLALAVCAKKLEDSNPWIRAIAADTLGRFGKSALPTLRILLTMLDDPNSKVQIAIENALVSVGRHSPKTLLSFYEKQKPSSSKNRLLRILLQFKPNSRSFFKLAKTAIEHASPQVREVGLNSVAEFALQYKSLIPFLIKKLETKGHFPKARLYWIFGKMGSETKQQTFPSLFKALSSSKWDQVAAAINALRKIKASSKTTLSKLLQLCAHQNPWVRRAAVEAIGALRTKSPKAIHTLKQRLFDKEIWVRNASAKALGKIGMPAIIALPELSKALSDKKWTVRYEVVLTLLQFGKQAEGALSGLRKTVGDKHWLVQKHTTEILGKIGTKGIEPLLSILNHKKWRPRYYSIKALGKIQPPQKSLVPMFIKMLKDKNRWVKASSAHALGKIGTDSQKAAPALHKLLFEKDPMIRQYAAYALGKIGKKSAFALATLQNLMKDPEKKVRKAVIRAIRRIRKVL